MKFAVFKYSDSIEDLHINKFIKKLPRRVLDFYIEKNNPYSFKKINVLGAEGFEVTLPFETDFVLENYGKSSLLLERTIDDFYINDVGIAVTKEGMPFVNSVRLSQGKAMLSFFIDEIVKQLLEKNQIDLKKAEILIVDGANFITDLIVDSIYENINYLSILTDNTKKFEEKEKRILTDTGLNINIINSSKNIALKTADVIINCAMDLENTDYFFKKGAVYIDTAKNSTKLKRIIEKRDDMTFIDGASFLTTDGVIQGDILEAAMFASDSGFKRFLTKGYDCDAQKNIKGYLNEKNIKVSGFYLMGNPLHI